MNPKRVTKAARLVRAGIIGGHPGPKRHSEDSCRKEHAGGRPIRPPMTAAPTPPASREELQVRLPEI